MGINNKSSFVLDVPNQLENFLVFQASFFPKGPSPATPFFVSLNFVVRRKGGAAVEACVGKKSRGTARVLRVFL